jgi:hypothetical protein
MPLHEVDKDEVRQIIATEIRDFVQSAVQAALNPPTEPTGAQHKISEEGMKSLQLVGKAAINAAETKLREANARVGNKTNPGRA